MKPKKMDDGVIFFDGELMNEFSELRVNGFKAFATEQVLPIAPITLIFGKNSSGKSTLIQALALMNEMFFTDNADIRYPRLGQNQIDLGGFKNFLNRNSSSFENLVDIDVKFTDRRNRDNVEGYGVSLGQNLLMDNQYSRLGVYGRDLEYNIRKVRIDSHYKKLELLMNNDLLWIETVENPFSYYVNLLMDEWKVECSKIDIKPLESLVKKSVKPLTNSSSDSHRISPSMRELVSSVAKEWLGEQRRMYSYSCVGSKLHCKDFLAGGYHVMDDDLADSVDYIVCPHNDSDTRDKAEQSIKEFISVDCLSKLDESGLGEEEFFTEVLKELDENIPKQLNQVFDSFYRKAFRLFQSLRYLGPIREMPDRAITDRFSHLNKYDSNSADAIYSEIRDSSLVRNKINRWLNGGLFSKKYFFDLDSQRQLRLFEYGSSKEIEVSLQDVGSGLSQVIPVLAYCLANSLKTLLLEQPELHLHPSGAAEMGDILIESALKEQGNTVIAETHSEHLILRILKRIRQTSNGTLPAGYPEIRPEDVSVVFVQPREDGNGSEIIRMPITEEGDVLFGFPDGFMPNRLEELF